MDFLENNIITWFDELSQAGLFNDKTKSPGVKPVKHQTRNHRLPSWDTWFRNIDYKHVSNLSDWDLALNAATQAGVCAFDLETSGLDPYLNDIRLIQLAIPVYSGTPSLTAPAGKSPAPGTSCTVYLLSLKDKDTRQFLFGLVNLLEMPGVRIIAHNGAFDLKMLRHAWGRRIRTVNFFDTMIASQLITAGNYIPGDQIAEWCAKHRIQQKVEANKTIFIGPSGHQIDFHELNMDLGRDKRVKTYYPRHRLSDLALRHLDITLDKSSQTADWSGELTEKMIVYAVMDVAVLLPLAEILGELIVKNELEQTADIEFNCIPAVAEIELSGMSLDIAATRNLCVAEREQLNKLDSSLKALAQEDSFTPPPKKGFPNPTQLNPDSPADLTKYLSLLAEQEQVLSEDKTCFEFTNISTGIPELFILSTNRGVLKRVVRRLPPESRLRIFIEELLRYRKLKSRSSGLNTFLEHLHPATARLHSSLKQLNPQGVGRFSASKPNLQQVSHDPDIRALFIPDPGQKLIIADYSAIEMGIMAALSQDQELLNAFNHNVDVHVYTAAYMTGKPLSDVTKEDRQSAKAINFGLIYGMSPKTLSEYAENSFGVQMTIEEAEASRRKFFQLYRGVREWQESESNNQFENKFVHYYSHSAYLGYFSETRPASVTFDGRHRIFPKTRKVSKKSGRPYVSMVGSVTELYNTPDQGFGASILKLAMGLLYEEFCERVWDDVKIIMTLHDELIISAPAVKASEAAVVLENAMRGAWDTYIENPPIDVKLTIADNWAGK